MSIGAYTRRRLQWSNICEISSFSGDLWGNNFRKFWNRVPRLVSYNVNLMWSSNWGICLPNLVVFLETLTNADELLGLWSNSMQKRNDSWTSFYERYSLVLRWKMKTSLFPLIFFRKKLVSRMHKRSRIRGVYSWKVLHDFVQSAFNARRGDGNQTSSLIVEAMKVLGNSSCGYQKRILVMFLRQSFWMMKRFMQQSTTNRSRDKIWSIFNSRKWSRWSQGLNTKSNSL